MAAKRTYTSATNNIAVHPIAILICRFFARFLFFNLAKALPSQFSKIAHIGLSRYARTAPIINALMLWNDTLKNPNSDLSSKNR